MAAEKLTTIKKELAQKTEQELIQLCLQMAKLKTENKEMLTYLLFDADEPLQYAERIKEEIDVIFWHMPQHQYSSIKHLRKCIKLINKYARFSKSKQGEVELLLHFSERFLGKMDSNSSFKPLQILLFRAMHKSKQIIVKMHEDLQFDYIPSYNEKVRKVYDIMKRWDNDRFRLTEIDQ